MNASLFDTFGGLPVHALVVHATVVAVPVVMVAVLAVAVRPAWRQAYGWYVVAVAGVTVLLVGLTILSGRELESRLGSTPEIARHEDLGNTVFWLTLAVAVVSALLVALQRRRGALVVVVAAAALVLSVGTLVQVVRTGHAGTDAVWGPVVESTG